MLPILIVVGVALGLAPWWRYAWRVYRRRRAADEIAGILSDHMDRHGLTPEERERQIRAMEDASR